MVQSTLVVVLLMVSACTATVYEDERDCSDTDIDMPLPKPACYWLAACRGDVRCFQTILSLNPDCQQMYDEVFADRSNKNTVKRAAFEDKRQGKKFRNIALNSYLNPLKG